MPESIRPLTQPNPPMCDFCREPAVIAALAVKRPLEWELFFCEQCYEKRRQKEEKR